VLSKYTRWGERSHFNIIASHFNSSWNASGQIPERAVDKGMIGWFGSFDASEGGSTSRTNLQFLHRFDTGDSGVVNSDFYLSYYTFNLFSDFTFMLNDPENWDEINQREKRIIGGGHTKYTAHFHVREHACKWAAGAGFRYDHIMDIALYHARNRHHIGTYALGDIDQSNLFAYGGMEINLGRVMINTSVRVDWFHFSYADKTAADFNSRGNAQAFVNPKLNVIVGDEAVVEPSGKSRRFGVDLGVRWDFLNNFYLQADYTYSNARMTEEPKGENYIPLAPVHTALGGLTYKNKHVNAGVHCRWIADRPANEDNSLTAKGYFITDLNASYT